MALTKIEKLILLGTGDAHPADAAALREASERDVVAVAMAASELKARGLLDENGYPTADGVRAVWS